MAYIYLFSIILLDTSVILVCRNLIHPPPTNNAGSVGHHCQLWGNWQI